MMIIIYYGHHNAMAALLTIALEIGPIPLRGWEAGAMAHPEMARKAAVSARSDS